MPPNLTRDLDAKIESQKTEIQSLQRELQSTQDSLNNWDEVNLISMQGVCVDESVATSTSSVTRITDPAISHLPHAGRDPELFQQRAPKLENSSTPTTSLPNGSTEATVTVPDYGEPRKREAETEAETIIIDANPHAYVRSVTQNLKRVRICSTQSGFVALHSFLRRRADACTSS